MLRRFFVAIKASPHLQAVVEEWQTRQHLPVRWVAPRNLHLTLVPPWEGDDEKRYQELLAHLASLGTSCRLAFTQVALGPHPREPRLIWATGSPVLSLAALQKEALRLFPNTVSPRAFVPHLTLARFNPEQFARFPDTHFADRVFWEEQVTSIVLMESQRLPSGAEYEVRAEANLANV